MSVQVVLSEVFQVFCMVSKGSAKACVTLDQLP